MIKGVLSENKIIEEFDGEFSWSQYWAAQNEVLFFAETKNIADGKLYNQVDDASDYLTVTGAVGSYTFECPDNVAYSDTDDDNIWFDFVSGNLRTVTEAELVSWDGTRTIIKYDDNTPYSIRWIAILKDGESLDSEQLNNLYNSFRLSVLWDGLYDSNGYIKGNRGLSYLPWETLGPELITNGGFDDTGVWETGAAWSIHDGRAYADGSVLSLLDSTKTWEVGSTYLIEIDQYDKIGVFYLYDTHVVHFIDGHNIITRVAEQERIKFRSNIGATVSIDNFSVKKILHP